MRAEGLQAEWLERYGRPEPKVICVGLNYRSHASEVNFDLPKAPLLFAKYANTLCGDGEKIVMPADPTHLDSEAELAVIIGETTFRVTKGDAMERISGYTCANDVSARDFQFGDGQWFRGKGYDTFCPIGPRIVAASEYDPSDVRVVQRLNGEVIQESRTSHLIFDIPTLVSYISHVVTLEPGDLILTGTPEGIGWSRQPKLSMKPGDTVEVEVEGIGVLKNTVATIA